MSACLLAALIGASANAAEPQAPEVAPVDAIWKAVDLHFSYVGRTTYYSCDSLEFKVAQILRAVGAHEKTRVSATGCPTNGPSEHAFVNITGGIAVPATAENRTVTGKDASKQELLKRLGVQPTLEQTQFAAVRKTIDLSRTPGLRLEPGDCELMEQLARDVLPKLGTTVVIDYGRCFTGRIPISTPPLKLDVLVRAPTADEISRADEKANRKK